jgi:hypothetical protein
MATFNIYNAADNERHSILEDCESNEVIPVTERPLLASVISKVPQAHFSTIGRYTFFHGSNAMSRSVTSGGRQTMVVLK